MRYSKDQEGVIQSLQDPTVETWIRIEAEAKVEGVLEGIFQGIGADFQAETGEKSVLIM